MFFHSTVFVQQAVDAWLTPIGQSKATCTGGVYLVHGSVSGPDHAYTAVLTLRLMDGRAIDVDVLVTSGGQIQEMVKVPAGVQAMRLSPGPHINVVRDVSVSLRRLLWPEYRFRQVRRVLPVFFHQPRQRRIRAGFNLRTLLTNLDYAYRVSCRFRANAYMRSYADWHDEFYSISPEDRHVMHKRLRHWSRPPHFQVVILGGATTSDGGESAAEVSLSQQIYPHFSVIRLPYDGWTQQLADMSNAFRREELIAGASASVGQSWMLVLRNGNRLSEAALYWLAHLISDNTSCPDMIYADHDVMTTDGRLSRPAFKPDWSPELLRATNYIGDAFAWRMRPLADIWDVVTAASYSIDGAFHSLILALTANKPKVGHALAPLWHLSDQYCQADDTTGLETSRVVATFLRARGVDATVEPDGERRCHVRYALPPSLPLVSIIIPTRDGLAHLQRCIHSLLQKTSYPAYEVIVVDNQSVQPETLAYLRTIAACRHVRVIAFDEPFNYSKINNYAVRQANGELICLLNNDTEVISPGWLTEMVGLALQESVGAVGAKLLYGDDTVQHGGDTVGPGGCANHLHTGIARDAPGYCGRAMVAQDLSAVTAACLLTHKSLYESLGGLNEIQLTVAFNDVDLCLRIRDAGLRVLWTPHALLYHHESITRGKDTSPTQIQRARSEVDYMRTRWAHLMHHDPFYNPNLNYQRPDFSLSGMPHVMLPWEAR